MILFKVTKEDCSKFKAVHKEKEESLKKNSFSITEITDMRVYRKESVPFEDFINEKQIILSI